MKQKILLHCLPLLIMMLPVKISSQAYPHDTLLIDGRNENLFYKGSCFCKAKVIKCDGEARGYRLHREIYDMCGEKDTSYTVIKSILTEGDEILIGDDYDINTGDDKDDRLTLQLENGVKIRFSYGTKISVSDDYCCKKEIWYTIKKGAICFISEGKEGTKKQCRSRYQQLLDLFTTYTVEITGEADITKVYEGSVEVSLLNPDMTDSDQLGEQIQQLSKDFQEGKISADEFAKQMKEYSEKIKNINEHMQPVNIEAGNKCIATKSSLTVEPIESNDIRWWEK